MKQKKFTFKTEKSTGRYRSFYSDTYIIKYNKKEVGNFISKGGYGNPPFKIQLRVIKKDVMEDGNLNCKWKNIILKKEFESVPEAKEWINKNIETILEKWELYLRD